MRQRLRALRKNDSGFTLIELLITVVILGVLSGVVVFAVANFNNEGVTAACKADVKNVEVAVEAYYSKMGTYPTAISPGATTVVGEGFLKEAPGSTKYTVNYDTTTHAVTGDIAGGAATTDCSA